MNNTNNAVTITGNGNIVAVINGKHYTATADHPKYHKLLDNARNFQWEDFIRNYDLVENITMYVSGDVQVKDGVIFYKNQIIHNTLTKKIISFMRNDLPFFPLLKFLENLLQNPSMRAVDELYDFLEAGELPITTDGCFLAYKNVRANFMDIHSGTFRNMVGDVCEMPRNRVDEDKNRTCSTGLHFCSIKYLPNFADSNGGHTMIVKINPKDVVAIPADYNNTKGRCSRYEVVGEYTEDWRSKLKNNESGWDADLYDEDGEVYDEPPTCEKCGTDLTGMHDNYEDFLCESCFNNDEDEDNGCDENHCFCDKVDEYGDIKCDKDQVGNQGDDHLVGGQNDNQYGVKPSGHKFHNLRDALGRFFKKNK